MPLWTSQVIADDNDAEDEVNRQDDTSDHDGDSSYDSQEGDAQELESTFGSKVYKLGMLEVSLQTLSRILMPCKRFSMIIFLSKFQFLICIGMYT
jgi:hypothetical protein